MHKNFKFLVNCIYNAEIEDYLMHLFNVLITIFLNFFHT